MEDINQFGHGAVKKTYKWLLFRCCWEGIAYSNQTLLDPCLVYKNHTCSNPHFFQDVPTTLKPFHVDSIDMIWPLPITAGRHCLILIAIKQLSKWFEAASSSSASAVTTSSFLLRNMSPAMAAKGYSSLTTSLISPHRL